LLYALHVSVKNWTGKRRSPPQWQQTAAKGNRHGRARSVANAVPSHLAAIAVQCNGTMPDEAVEVSGVDAAGG
jgi:hypothetical protein